MRRATILWLLLGSALGSADDCNNLNNLDWLIGTWETREGQNITTEQWVKVSANTLEGIGQSYRAGQVVSTESLRLVDMSGALFFIAKVSHNIKPIVFSLTECSANAVGFENLSHDFPKRITYRRSNEGKLIAQVSDAASQGFTLEFSPAATLK